MLRIINMLLWFLVIPEFLGLAILRFNKKENISIVFSLIVGYLFEFMVYEIYAIPMTFLKMKFTTLSYFWIITIIVLFVISIKFNLDKIKSIIKDNLKELKKFPIVLSVIFVMIVGLQCFICFKYMHQNYDDSNFVAKATIAKDTNTLHKYNDIGEEYTSLPGRQLFSPFPFYTATMSLIMNLHPTIIARTIFPVVFIPLVYMVYYMIGNVLFKDNKKKTFTFLIILTVLYTFGSYTSRNIFTSLLYRIWQGKSILANLIIPFIWLIFMKYINKEEKYYYWIILFITLWGANLLSSMSLSVCCIEVGILSLIYTIRDKKISYLLKSLICMIPSITYGIIYLFFI